MRYIPNSPDERRSMLAEMGCERIEDLFEQVPEKLRLKEPIGIGGPMSEPDLLAYFRELASQNAAHYQSFLGAGAYSHFIPTVIDPLISRAEFFTAYTPYQPELSQGTLQYIFEFQTMICQLTGMEVANASLYDGSTAVAESVLMANRVTRRDRFVIADTIHPQYREVTASYTKNLGLNIDYARHTEAGTLDLNSVRIDRETAAVVVQSPNFFGCVEDLTAIAEAAHQAGALFVVAISEPMSLGALRPPGACGADIVVGEAQSFGIPLSYGGPYCGMFATNEKYMRQMPGRLVGEATDAEGRRGYVLTLSTREQHIRREKATSNICTNQGLFALMATVYLATMGRRGIQEVARQNLQKAHYAAAEVAKLEGFALKFAAPFFNEFVVRTPRAATEVTKRLLDRKIIGGVELQPFYPDMADSLLVCVTETARKEAIDNFVAALAEG
ncbi:MAG TPA: aminomethyl-transferring glycine dehydrogenase subunit GcvPA [Blastocatellia bacterium]|jgi:glycine dehydrogenase subunit 1|nr:aminomethyl-transferring glycine dehydrogenase subunit GcvPA [Blastocatellia bacterium]